MPGVTPPKAHGLITIDALSNDLRVRTPSTGAAGGTLVTLTSASYFIRAYAGEGVNQLVEHVQAQVRLVAGFGAFLCTVSDTGFVTVSLGATFDINWDDTALRNILGFTGNLSGANSYTAPNQHRFGWYPNEPPRDMTGDADLDGVPESDTVVQRAPSGVVTTTTYFTSLYSRRFEFSTLDADYMFPTGNPLILNRDLETFWRDVMVAGRRFRWYYDRTVQTAPGGGAPWTYVAADPEDMFTKNVERTVATWSRLYKASFRVFRYVGT